MISSRAHFTFAAFALGWISAIALPTGSEAQSYPSRLIKLIVPFPAGGPLDVGARIIAQRLSATLGQTVVIENVPGASGMIGARAVAKAPPDGYTLLISGASALVISPLLSKGPEYDPLKDFAPVAEVSVSRSMLVANPALPANSVQELVAYAQAHPGKLNYGSAGLGTPPHLATEYLKMVTGIDVVHVPYKGGGTILADLATGQIDMVFQVLPLVLPLVRAGKIKALAVASATRAPELPNVPTMIESGFPGFVADNWSAILAPAGLPADVVHTLNAAINAGLGAPEVKAALAKAGLATAGGTPEDLAKLIADEWKRWGAVADAAGLRGK